MAVSTTVSRNLYLGTGNLSTYAYTFQILENSDLRVATRDEDGLVSELILGVDYSVVGVGNDSGGTITLLGGNLPANVELVVMHDPEFLQEFRFNNLGASYYPERHEKAYDRNVRYSQVLKEEINRAIKFAAFDGPFDATLPKLIPDSIVRVNSAANGLILAGPGEFIGPAGPQGNPLFVGQADPNDVVTWDPVPNPNDLFLDENGAFWKFNGVDWTLTGDELSLGETATAIGYSARYSDEVNLLTLQEIVNYIFNFQYVAPSVVLNSDIGTGPYEKGDPIEAINFTASITKRSDPIGVVRFYQSGVEIDTQVAGGAIPNGGSSAYSWAGSITDTTTFSVQVDDTSANSKPSNTASRTFNFVYPYFWGTAANNSQTAAQVAAMTKDIRTSSASVERTFSASAGNYFYFAQPASYPAITKIFDANGFEVQGNFTSFTGSYTALDGSTQSLRVYRNVSPIGVDTYLRFTR